METENGTTELINNPQYVVNLEDLVFAQENYKEIHVPVLKSSVLDPGEVLYPISNLSKYAQPVFDDYKVLNHIQTHTVNVALKSNENMFLCASTDTGKIN
ncbi:unnamed protein product, partial [Rotaria sp. Silwood1]